MESQERATFTERSNSLRFELKAWEKVFSRDNNGQKAAREDIKKVPEIGKFRAQSSRTNLTYTAAKYKEYNNLRDTLSGKLPLSYTKAQPDNFKKRKDESESSIVKHQRIASTPSKTPSRVPIKPWDVDAYDSPSVIRNLFTPSKKTAIGPTPQKDGQVLGIFDSIPDEESESQPTPSRKEVSTYTGAPVSTPCNMRTEARKAKYTRTPESSSKRRMLDMLATPLKDRHANVQGGTTPFSISKLSTPSFLRRNSKQIKMPLINENDEPTIISPQMVRMPPKRPLVRGLSSILASLRKMQDKAADDDLDALREMENEAAAENTAPPNIPAKNPEPRDVIPEPQHGLPLGGFDNEAALDSSADEADPGIGLNGKAPRIWKKKGAKRTTRHVKMKPTKVAPPTIVPISEGEDGPGGVVPESNLVDDSTAFVADAKNFDSDTQSEYTASEGGTRYRRPGQRKHGGEGAGKGKRKVKANAAAHQNFKRLKIRNTGTKGKAGHGSRFKRRR